MSKDRLWSKDFILASLINFQMVLVFYMLVVIIASYAIQELNANTTQAGLISGLFIIGALVGRLVIHAISQRIGQQKTLWLSLIIFCLSAVLYCLPVSIVLLFFIRFLHGFSYGLASTIVSTLIAQITPKSRLGEGIGYFSLSNTIGAAVGPLLTIYLSIHASYQWIFIFCVAISLLGFILSFYLGFSNPTQLTKDVQAPSQNKSTWLNQTIEVKVIPISLIVLISALSYSGVLSFINYYAEKLQLHYAGLLFFLVYAVAVFLSRPLTGKIMDQKGENIVMYPALLALAVGMLLLSFAHSTSLFLICAVLFGLGFGNIQSIGQTIAIKSTTLDRAGLATSTYLIAFSTGLGFGPFLLGVLLNYVSYAQMYLYSALLSFCAIALYYLLHGRKVQQQY